MFAAKMLQVAQGFSPARISLLLLVAVFLAAASPAAAQDEPFVVHDTKSVIVHGPYLVEPGEDAVTIVWTNHEMRGPFARALFDYVPVSTGEYYHAFDHGPIHFVVLDSGEDKDDDTNVYARLNEVEPYREQELAWWRHHVATDPRVRDAAFQVVLVHQPDFGYVGGENRQWVTVANQARVDLVIAGHRHRFRRVAPGEQGNDYTILVLGQDQLARVDATAGELRVTVVDKDRSAVDAFTLQARRSP